MIAGLKDVEDFWSNNPCGSWSAMDTGDRIKYFSDIEAYRYGLIPSIIEMGCFDQFRDKKVLEIGCGVGTDGRRFAKNGAIYTGINIDKGSTDLATENFKLFQLNGNIIQMNAEAMTFGSETFDHIYSCGVIFASPSPENIVKGMYRVLKKGGTATVMLYNRTSINYYFEIMFLRKIFRQFLRPKYSPMLISKLTGLDRYKLERHRELLKKKFTKEEWISVNTDGPDHPLSRVYNRREAEKLFREHGFFVIKQCVRFFDKTHYPFIQKVTSKKLQDFLGSRWGWNRWLFLKK